MSLIGWYKTRIKLDMMQKYGLNIETHPNFELLRKSIEIVAKKHNGEIRFHVVDALGREKKCDIAFATPDFSRGIGIKIDRNTGELYFLYDKYDDVSNIAKKLSGEVLQHYTAIALINAMKAYGYNVREDETQERDAIILISEV
ncbi:MAG: hypothetical protein QXX08_06890 [Candidatus Bathyarchaeia archaeon]